MVFNVKKVYKDLLTERSTPEKDLRVAPQSTPEQQRNAADSEFVELDDVLVEKSQSILEGNEESRVESLTPQPEVRRSTRQIKAPDRYFLFLHYLLLTDSGKPECYKKVLQVEAKDKWELFMDDEVESLIKNQT